jgi:hypothetical protein
MQFNEVYDSQVQKSLLSITLGAEISAVRDKRDGDERSAVMRLADLLETLSLLHFRSLHGADTLSVGDRDDRRSFCEQVITQANKRPCHKICPDLTATHVFRTPPVNILSSKNPRVHPKGSTQGVFRRLRALPLEDQ